MTTEHTPASDASWLAEATKQVVNYWAARELIKAILEMLPDEEFWHYDFDRTELPDGSVLLSMEDWHYDRVIGQRCQDGRPSASGRQQAIDELFDSEAVHRANLAHWRHKFHTDPAYRAEVSRWAAEQQASERRKS